MQGLTEKENEIVAKIFKRWHSDEENPHQTLDQAAFDIGYLMGLISKLAHKAVDVGV